jgi:hypothetical protein
MSYKKRDELIDEILESVNNILEFIVVSIEEYKSDREQSDQDEKVKTYIHR